MKYLFKKFLATLIATLFVGISVAQAATGMGGGIATPAYWYLDGTVLKPVSSSWTVYLPIGGTADGPIIIDVDNDEAFVVRKDGAAGDILIVDTNNSEIEIGGPLILANSETLSNAVNGKITFTGVGQTNNEDLTLDFETVADQIGFSSSTGVADFDFGAIDLNTTGEGSFEHLISTDDADINDALVAGDITIDEAAGVLQCSGATSCSILSDSDALTIGGVNGAANNEDMNFDFETIADAITIASSTNVADWNFTDIDLNTTTEISAEHIISTDDLAVTDAITAASLDLGSTVVLVGTIDDDTMGTATDTTVATSESIKAYADAIVAALGALKANIELDNLATVAINESLISDTAATDNLGSEAIYWLKLFLDSEISFEGSTDDDWQTTFSVTDPTTVDKTIAFQDADGIVAMDATAVTDLEGSGLAITAGTLNWTAGIDDLSDVDTTSVAPVVDQHLTWNGADWTPKDAPVSATTGLNFYNDNTSIIASGAQNNFALETLAVAPSGGGEVVEATNCTSNTVPIDAYLDGVLGITTIPAGTWSFETYASVSSVVGGRVSTITRSMYQAVPDAVNTVTTTGAGATRTATASGGTPFAAGDANADQTLAGYVHTPKGLYQITGFTNATTVTIATPVAYVNEAGVALTTWKYLFDTTTDTIMNLTTDYGLYTHSSVQSAFTINATDQLGTIAFATSNNTTTVNFVYEGTEHYTHFSAPLVTNHNDLPALQGGAADEYYHLTSAEYTGSGTGVFSRIDSPTFTTDIDVTGGGDIDADGVDLDAGNAYEIAGTDVLDATTLGANIVNSSLTNFGTVSALGMGTGDITLTGAIGRDTDNEINWGTDDSLAFVIGGTTDNIVGIDRGVGDNDTLVTQGYVDDGDAVAAADINVKVSADDTTTGYLDGELVAGTGITFTVNNPAGAETMTISTNDYGIDHGGLSGLGDDDHTHYFLADGSRALTGDMTTTGTAIDWDLLDNNAAALSFDTAGLDAVMNIDTLDGAEVVEFGKDINIAGVIQAVTSIAIGANILDTNEWAFLDGVNQALATTSDVTFDDLITTGGRITNRTAVNDAAYTPLADDHLIAYTAISAPRIIDPQDATCTAGREYTVKDEAGAAGAQNLTIDPEGGTTIDGALTFVLSANYNSVTFYCNGSNWFVK